MNNKKLAGLLSQFADYLELGDENPFRIRAVRRGADIIESTPDDLGQMDRKQILAIPGIGKGLADLIEEYKNTSAIAELTDLVKTYPPDILDVMNVQGVGAKRAALLYKKLKIGSLEKLARAAKENKLVQVSGFGPTLQASILKNVSFAQNASKRILITDARSIAHEILTHLRKSSTIQNPTVAGSFRRWKETVGDLDFLCTSPNPDKAIAHFQKSPGMNRILASGQKKSSLILESGLQCDFRVVDPTSFGAAILYFTGSKEHNVRLRERAQRKGWTLNEYGLFRKTDKKHTKPIASKTENDIYRKLGLQWIPPELREDRGEIDAALKDSLPDLVEETDVCGDFHNHTTYSDGADSLAEMLAAAKNRKWKWYYSADHSPSLTIANGVNETRLKKKWDEIKKLKLKFKGIYLGCSSEVDILDGGKLDYPDRLLASFDCVVASVHRRFNQSKQDMTKRICTAASNPHVDILGHVTGRLINRRAGYDVDMEQILSVLKSKQTAIEINGQAERQELQDIYVKKAVQMGIPVALSTDAHSTDQHDNMTLAVHIARRGWAEKKNIINCLKTSDVKKWLNR